MTNRKEASGNRTRYEKRGVYESQYKNADQTEWAAFIAGSAHISAGTRDDMMSDSAMENGEPSLPGDSYMTREAVEEGLQASVLEIVEERSKLLGTDGYPFRLINNSLTFSGELDNPYLALLALCQLPTLSSTAYKDAPMAFEYMSLIAARAYLGQRSRGWRFGWPRTNNSHMKVSDAAKELKRRAGNDEDAWHWCPVPSKPEIPSTRDLKDAGMDFVAWIPWIDEGPGQLHLVGQCACGEDWKWKKHDLDLNKLGEWMRLPHPQPIRGIFTPRHLALPTIRDTTTEAGLVFDRIRIAQEIQKCVASRKVAGKFARKIVCISLSKD